MNEEIKKALIELLRLYEELETADKGEMNELEISMDHIKEVLRELMEKRK